MVLAGVMAELTISSSTYKRWSFVTNPTGNLPHQPVVCCLQGAPACKAINGDLSKTSIHYATGPGAPVALAICRRCYSYVRRPATVNDLTFSGSGDEAPPAEAPVPAPAAPAPVPAAPAPVPAASALVPVPAVAPAPATVPPEPAALAAAAPAAPAAPAALAPAAAAAAAAAPAAPAPATAAAHAAAAPQANKREGAPAAHEPGSSETKVQRKGPLQTDESLLKEGLRDVGERLCAESERLGAAQAEVTLANKRVLAAERHAVANRDAAKSLVQQLLESQRNLLKERCDKEQACICYSCAVACECA